MNMFDTTSGDDDAAQEWQKPVSTSAQYGRKPYPLDYLPPLIANAIREAVAFNKVPIPLAATSALSQISLAVQGLCDVKRAEGLVGSCGLFTLAIAESGERKTSCDSHFGRAIREHEARALKAAAPLMQEYAASFEAWEQKVGAAKELIRTAAKKGESTGDYEDRLQYLKQHEPVPPRIPNLIYQDATPEALAYGLSRWPSGGIISSEAGSVFGSHGMGSDSAMRNMALWNSLWDGKSVKMDRRGSASINAPSSRLTISLQVQEVTLREFFGKAGKLARGTGLMARFLITNPETTQGTRFWTEPPAEWPHAHAFDTRMFELLGADLPINEDGVLVPAVLEFDEEARAEWIRYYNTIESMQTPDGELSEVRDVAAKSADNVARLAALFHVFDCGLEGLEQQIDVHSLNSAKRIGSWYLSEARAMLGILDLPEVVLDANKLEAHLIKICRTNNVDHADRYMLRHSGLDKGRFEAALDVLVECGRVRKRQILKRQLVYANPALLADKAAP